SRLAKLVTPCTTISDPFPLNAAVNCRPRFGVGPTIPPSDNPRIESLNTRTEPAIGKIASSPGFNSAPSRIKPGPPATPGKLQTVGVTNGNAPVAAPFLKRS